MKYIKRIFFGLVILLVLIAAFVFVLITFYKKEMATVLTDSLKTNYGLSLQVEDVDVSFLSNWPQASVQLKGIRLASDLYPDKEAPILKAGSLSLSFNLRKLLEKQFIVRSISIKDAQFNLMKDSSGVDNFTFKKQPPPATADTTGPAIRFEVNKITIRNTQFDFVNQGKKQHIGILFEDNIIRLDHAQDGFKAAFTGDIKVDELLFNEKKGAFLKNTEIKTDLDLSVYLKSKMVIVHPSSSLTIKKQPYGVNAFVSLKDTSWLMLRVEGKQVDYTKTAQLLTPKIQAALSNFSVEKPFDAKVMIVAKLNIKEDPILIVDLEVKDNAVKIGNSKIPYSGLSFKGRVISLDSSHKKGNIDEARITFTGIKGLLYDHPFTASVNLHNLSDPDIHINGRLFIEAQKIKFRVAQDFILKGNCVATLSYWGPVNKLNKTDFLSPAMHLNADMAFNNFSYQEANKPFVYVVKGKASVNNRDLKFENLLLKTDAGEAVLKGKAEGFVNYVLGFSNTLKADLSARTDYFNLNPFLPQKTAAQEKQEAAADTKKEDKKTTADYKQTVQDNESSFEFNTSLFAKKLYIRKVEAENASIVLSYKKKLLTMKSVNANTCGGRISARGSIYDLSRISAEMEMQDIDIQELFNEFENFGQKKVESRHLKGRVFLKATFKTELDENMEVKGSTMAGDVKLKLKDGHLQNFEPVQSMSNFIFRNRDFNDVAFTELNESFRIRGYEMEIQELEVGSNILNMYVTGVYNFKENSNINILVPWHNLKKRGKHYIPKNYAEGIENAKGLKLNFSGPTSNMKLSLGHKQPGEN